MTGLINFIGHLFLGIVALILFALFLIVIASIGFAVFAVICLIIGKEELVERIFDRYNDLLDSL